MRMQTLFWNLHQQPRQASDTTVLSMRRAASLHLQGK